MVSKHLIHCKELIFKPKCLKSETCQKSFCNSLPSEFSNNVQHVLRYNDWVNFYLVAKLIRRLFIVQQINCFAFSLFCYFVNDVFFSFQTKEKQKIHSTVKSKFQNKRRKNYFWKFLEENDKFLSWPQQHLLGDSDNAEFWDVKIEMSKIFLKQHQILKCKNWMSNTFLRQHQILKSQN